MKGKGRFLLGLIAFAIAHDATATPDFAQIKAATSSSEATLLDRHGERLHEQRADLRNRHLGWINLERISPAMTEALIASEDQRFLSHKGVDWKAFAAAAWGNLWREKPRGASTLTMQLVGLLEPDLKARKDGRSLAQKWAQAQAARELERSWSKREILEAYLNLASFRGELQGIAAAAQGLFGKHPSGLDRPESLLLAALLRAPNAKSSPAAKHACALALRLTHPPDCRDVFARAALLDGRYRIVPNRTLAPHIAQKLLRQSGEPIKTSLDTGAQRYAVDALHRHLEALPGRNVEDGAVVVIDNASGDILAWVGSSANTSAAPHVDGVTALRQAGSTLKPFLYQLALEARLLTASSILDDTPVNLTTPTGLYVPQNYDREFSGQVSLRTALGSSLNVPAVRTLLLVGVDAFHERLRQLGFASLAESADFYGYSLALGSADVSLFELTNAYRALANLGVWSNASPRFEYSTRSRIMQPAAAFIIADILADRDARARTFGFDNPLATRFWSAVKTGTSKDMRDNWCIGFSMRYTVGVWVGNFSGEPMWDVSGITGAAPIWSDIMHYLHAGDPGHPPATPTNVSRQRVSFESELEPARDEWFAEGTEVARLELAEAYAARIAYPGNEMIIALDPDIPFAQQVVYLSAHGRAAGLRWRLDDAELGGVGRDNGWQPTPGRHTLALIDSEGGTVDSVRFEVRGALPEVKPPTRASGSD